MEHCQEHSGVVEKLDHICKLQEEMHVDIKKLLEPNGIYFRVAKLEAFKGTLIKIAATIGGGGGITAVVIKLLDT